MNRRLLVLFCLPGSVSVCIGAVAAESPSQTETNPLSFDEALSRILGRSTAIATQQASLESTRAGALPSKFAFVPSVSFDAKSANASGIALQGPYSLVEATSQYNLFHWGADFAGLGAGNADIESQESQLLAVTLQAEDDAVSALIAEVQQQKQLDIDRDVATMQEKLEKIARERFSHGFLARQEVEKVSVDLDNANAAVADAVLLEINTRTQLESFLGPALVIPEWPWKEKLSGSGQKLLALPWNVEARPDWRAARNHAIAEDKRYVRDERLLLPSLDASFSYGYYNGVSSSVTDSGGAYGWNSAITVSLPFFDHLTTYSNARAQLYVRAAADVAVTQVERTAQAAWEAARDGFKIALDAAVARERTLGVSRRLYQDSLKRFQAGRITANDLVIDQRRLLDSELFSVQGWAAAHLAFPRLCHAFGKKITECW